MDFQAIADITKSRHCQDCKQPLPYVTQIIKERPDGSKSIVRLPGKAPGKARCHACHERYIREYNRKYKQAWRKRRKETHP